MTSFAHKIPSFEARAFLCHILDINIEQFFLVELVDEDTANIIRAIV